MSKQFVIIEESGDPGLKNSNTTHLIIVAVIVADREKLTELNAAIDGFRAGLGWKELDEFKFSSTRKSVIIDLLKFVRRFEFEAYALAVDKTRIISPPQLSSKETLYHRAIKELLLRMTLTEPIIIIDGVADKKSAQQTRTYLRQALRQQGVEKCKISFVDSRKETIVQLADIIAGSVARSFDKDKADHNDYLKILGTKLKEIFDITS